MKAKWTQDDMDKFKRLRMAVYNELTRLEENPMWFYDKYCGSPRENLASEKPEEGSIDFFNRCRIKLKRMCKGHFDIIITDD